MPSKTRTENRRALHQRIRKKIIGSPERPRLCVFFSGQHVYAQIIDDHSGRTMAAVATTEKSLRPSARSNQEVARKVGELIAERAKSAKINRVVFDRAGFKYHGKVKALADAAREKGLEF